MSATITITYPDMNARAPLLHYYPTQNHPRAAYLEMDEDGHVRTDWDSEAGTGNTVPERVWNGRTLRWRISPRLTAAALCDFLEDEATQALLEQIHRGHTVDYDGRNMRGHLADDAKAAERRLQEAIDDIEDDVKDIDIDEWLDDARMTASEVEADLARCDGSVDALYDYYCDVAWDGDDHAILAGDGESITAWLERKQGLR
jgi:hypothetical protein